MNVAMVSAKPYLLIPLIKKKEKRKPDLSKLICPNKEEEWKDFYYFVLHFILKCFASFYCQHISSSINITN